MKKAIVLICLLSLVLSFAGCQKQTNNQNNNGTSNEATVIGKVTTIDGNIVTLQLGKLEEGGMPPEKPSDVHNDNGEVEVPPEIPKGEDDITPPSETLFVAGDETITVDLTDVVITVEVEEGTSDGDINDIAVGNILVVEMSEEQNPLSVIVKNIAAGPGGEPGEFGTIGDGTQGRAATIINKDGTYSEETYTSNGDDENALCIVGAEVTLDGITVNKDSGNSSNTENGDFYGINAALLAMDGANVTITNAVINSSAKNGNGVFSYGENTVINISDSTITTKADNSGGIQTTGGGTTNATNLQVTTSGNSSAAIRSDRGGGMVTVEGGSYISNGYNSPAVYSTADISVKNAVLTANHSEALVVEGRNSVLLENCTVSGNMSDTRGSSSDINVHNVMIYQSMSGDADEGTARFAMRKGSLTSDNGDMFYVTNTQCVLILSGVSIVNNEEDGYFLLVSGNDASQGWGEAGSNGAQVAFTADEQTFEGDIAVDSISTLTMALTNGSVYTGAVNIIENEQDGSAVEINAIITIDSGSVWNLTGNCRVTSVMNGGTINFNGYTITLADGTVLSN